MYLYVTLMLLVCIRMLLVCTCMLLVCIRMLLVCYSYVTRSNLDCVVLVTIEKKTSGSEVFYEKRSSRNKQTISTRKQKQKCH